MFYMLRWEINEIQPRLAQRGMSAHAGSDTVTHFAFVEFYF